MSKRTERSGGRRAAALQCVCERELRERRADKAFELRPICFVWMDGADTNVVRKFAAAAGLALARPTLPGARPEPARSRSPCAARTGEAPAGAVRRGALPPPPVVARQTHSQ